MSSILILKTSSNTGSDNMIVDQMASVVKETLTNEDFTFDEVHIQSYTQLQTALAYYVETGSYEGAVCLGYVTPTFESPSYAMMYQETVRTLFDFSSYYSFPVGIGILFDESKELNVANAKVFAGEATNAVLSILNNIRSINTLDVPQYAPRNKRHN